MGKHITKEYDCKKLKAAIKQKGFTQEAFADMVGSSASTIAGIISGGRKPSVTLNKIICLLLEVPEDEFLVKPEPPKPEPEEPIPDKQIELDRIIDRLAAQLDRIERKVDRLEMMSRSIQNENLALRQELLKRK